MLCDSCGDESGSNYCPACGTPTAHAEEAPKRGVDAGGAIVLVLTLIAVGATFGSMPSSGAGGIGFRLPAWMSITRPREAAPPAAVRIEPAPDVPAPAPAPAEPYETVSETALQLSEYRLVEVHVRLGAGRTPADVDGLLRSKVKSLRDSGVVALLKLYAQASDATSSDRPLVTYVAADLDLTPYGDPALAGMAEIEADLYRTPLPR